MRMSTSDSSDATAWVQVGGTTPIQTPLLVLMTTIHIHQFSLLTENYLCNHVCNVYFALDPPLLLVTCATYGRASLAMSHSVAAGAKVCSSFSQSDCLVAYLAGLLLKLHVVPDILSCIWLVRDGLFQGMAPWAMPDVPSLTRQTRSQECAHNTLHQKPLVSCSSSGGSQWCPGIVSCEALVPSLIKHCSGASNSRRTAHSTEKLHMSCSGAGQGRLPAAAAE
jgi:hypothetical protein